MTIRVKNSRPRPLGIEVASATHLPVKIKDVRTRYCACKSPLSFYSHDDKCAICLDRDYQGELRRLHAGGKPRGAHGIDA